MYPFTRVSRSQLCYACFLSLWTNHKFLPVIYSLGCPLLDRNTAENAVNFAFVECGGRIRLTLPSNIGSSVSNNLPIISLQPSAAPRSASADARPSHEPKPSQLPAMARVPRIRVFGAGRATAYLQSPRSIHLSRLATTTTRYGWTFLIIILGSFGRPSCS